MPKIEEEIKQNEFTSEIVKSNINILYTANWIYNKISSKLKPFNVTHEQFNVLRILRGSHPSGMSQKEVLARMIAPNSNITLIVSRLKSKNLLIVNKSEEDSRQYVINIAESGLHILSEIDKLLKEEKVDFNKLSVSEAFHLNALLDKLRG